MRQALTSLDGILAAEVTFDPARAVVRFRSDLVAPDDMVKAIEALGFKAHAIEHLD